jgi:hypothetical protein
MNWRYLNQHLSGMTEQQVHDLLEQERKTLRRVTILERLHQRYTVLRAARERMEILKEAIK